MELEVFFPWALSSSLLPLPPVSVLVELDTLTRRMDGASCPPPPCSLHSQNLGATNCPMICFPFSSSGIGGSLWISAVQQASSKEMKCQSPFLQTTPLYVSCFLAAPDLAEIGRSITKQFRAPCKLSSKKSPFSNQFLYSFAFLSLYL